MNRTQKLAACLLAITLAILIIASCIRCDSIAPDVDVDCDCQTCEDCLLTVDEGKALVRCLNEGGDVQECLDLYLWDNEDKRQEWLDVIEEK